MMSKEEDRYQVLLEAIELERKDEEEYYISLSKDKSIKEKIESGILWYPLNVISQYYTVGEQIELTLERIKHLETPHKLKSGVACQIFGRTGNENEFTAKGVISYIKRNRISIILNDEYITKDQLSNLKGHIGVMMTHDERPYKVMRSTIELMMKSEDQKIVDLRENIRRVKNLDGTFDLENLYAPPHLNDSQSDALKGCMCSEQLGIIHGPPGTGKTTTLVALIKELVKTEKKILVCAPSNNAVDLLAASIDMHQIPTIRVGNVTRIADNLTHLTIAEKARSHPEWKHIKRVKIEAEEAKKSAGKFKRSFGHQQRSDRKAMYKESRELRKWARDLEDKLLEKLIQQSNVICSTLIGVSHKSINHIRYSTLIIDEASQALEPECWNAMLKADRVILAGDHLQLAPTVKSREAELKGLGNTLLNRLTGKVKHSYLLDTQYRMNDKILSFSNKRFYHSKLKSATGIDSWTLEGDQDPIVLIDTSGCGFEEVMNPKSLSRFNSGEFFILREHFLQHQEKYINKTIGIISPYREQVKFLTNKIEEDEAFSEFDISIGSIDGFQGQEKDIIYISLVRSNNKGEIGFLKDERRLNVAMTRARKKLILIGDMSTLSQSILFNDLAEHIEKEGKYQSAWEYMAVD